MAGKRVAPHWVRRTLICERLEDCQRECGDEKRFSCEGFNYRLNPSGRGQGECELIEVPLSQMDLYSSPNNRDANLIRHPDYDYYERDRSTNGCRTQSPCIDCENNLRPTTYRPPLGNKPGYNYENTAIDKYRPQIYEPRPDYAGYGGSMFQIGVGSMDGYRPAPGPAYPDFRPQPPPYSFSIDRYGVEEGGDNYYNKPGNNRPYIEGPGPDYEYRPPPQKPYIERPQGPPIDYGNRPDRPSGVDYSNRPDNFIPSSKPEYPSPIKPSHPPEKPDYPSTRPEYPSKPDYPVSKPDYPSNRPDYPISKPDYPSTRPEYPISKPDYPSSRPDYPVSKPDYPSSRPDYPVSKPDYPSSGPDYPISRPDYPSTRPEYPVSKPEYPSPIKPVSPPRPSIHGSGYLDRDPPPPPSYHPGPQGHQGKQPGGFVPYQIASPSWGMYGGTYGTYGGSNGGGYDNMPYRPQIGDYWGLKNDVKRKDGPPHYFEFGGYGGEDNNLYTKYGHQNYGTPYRNQINYNNQWTRRPGIEGKKEFFTIC